MSERLGVLVIGSIVLAIWAHAARLWVRERRKLRAASVTVFRLPTFVIPAGPPVRKVSRLPWYHRVWRVCRRLGSPPVEDASHD